MTPFSLGDFQVGTGRLTVIAGPCVAESLDLCLQVAREMRSICDDLDLDYVFKASFDKANRTSVDSVRGFGLEEGLRIIQEAGKAVGSPTTTDIHLPDQAAPVAEVVDLLQIPAFLCRQSDLLEAAAATGRPVNVKKGQFLAPADTKNIVQKLVAFGAHGTMLTERGTSFGYNTLIVDMPGWRSCDPSASRSASTPRTPPSAPAAPRAPAAVCGNRSLRWPAPPSPSESMRCS